MRAEFTGMVVAPGSPHDGKVVASKTPYLRLVAKQPIPSPGRKTAPTDVKEVVEGFIWERMECQPSKSHPRREWGFWIPEGKSTGWAIDTMIQAYQKGVRK